MSILKVPRWKQHPWLETLGGKRHTITREGVYLSAEKVEYRIPVGFVTDGGSVPRALWWWMPPFGDNSESAYVLHDHVYRYAEHYPGMTRKVADDLLREAAVAAGHPAARARAAWIALRMFGGGPWKTYRQQVEEPEAA